MLQEYDPSQWQCQCSDVLSEGGGAGQEGGAAGPLAAPGDTRHHHQHGSHPLHQAPSRQQPSHSSRYEDSLGHLWVKSTQHFLLT